MEGSYAMDIHTGEIKALLRNMKLSPKYKLAVDKFFMWEAYYDHVFNSAKGNPNIISMAFTQKILAYIGIAESLFPRDKSSSDKIKLFFSYLDEMSKLLVTISWKYGSSQPEREAREGRIIKSFINNTKSFEKYFFDIIYIEKKKSGSDKGRALLNLRNRLSHRGEYLVCFVNGSTGKITRLFSPGGLKFSIDESIMSLDEAFLRGIVAKAGLRIPKPKERARSAIINRGFARMLNSQKKV